MALKIHPEGSKGLYKDNLSGVARAKVEIRKQKGDEGNLVAGVTVEERKRKDFLRYKGELGSKTTTTTVPRQWHQKCLLVFLNCYREVRKRTEIPL